MTAAQSYPADLPPAELPATPDYVLAVLRDWARYADFAPPEELTFATTVERWGAAAELDAPFRPRRALGRWLNDLWDLDATDARWAAVLEPAGSRTLADVCGFIAARTTRPVVRPANLCGATCAKAGAFRAVRGLLTAAGLPPAEAARIAPSTELSGYVRRFPSAFIEGVARLAPGVMPVPWESDRGRFVLGCLGALGLAPAFCLLMLGDRGAPWFVVGMYAAGAASWRAAGPPSVRTGTLRTFRDLAEAIAAGAVEPRPSGSRH